MTTDTHLDAERILVATAMAQPAIVDTLAAEGFDPADILDERHRMIWYAVEDLAPRLTHGEIRWEAVAHKTAAWHAEGRTTTRPYDSVELAQIYNDAMPGAASHWATEVTRAAIAHRTRAAGVSIRLRGDSPAFDPTTDIPAIQAEVDNLVRPAATTQTTRLADLLPAALQRATTPPTAGDRIPTGFVDLDHLLTGGWAPGQLVIVGARPAMGKTTLAAGFARAAAITHKTTTLFVSLEMGRDELTNTILSSEARIALHHLKRGEADDAAMHRAALQLPKLADAPLYIDDSPLLTLPGLRAMVRHHTRTNDLRLVVVDYLQLMQAPNAESRQVAVSMLSRQLKLLAKEFGITVIVLSQLNRGNEQRSDKTPMVSDLRESGSIEQDADIVILLHRDDAYQKESPRSGEADLIVGKHRGGATATITVGAQLHYSRFVDMADEG
jgi:replicative DNA helicase